MKHVNQNSENDENSQPTALNLSKTNEKKKNALHRSVGNVQTAQFRLKNVGEKQRS